MENYMLLRVKSGWPVCQLGKEKNVQRRNIPWQIKVFPRRWLAGCSKEEEEEE
jgi:hypothetical protein